MHAFTEAQVAFWSHSGDAAHSLPQQAGGAWFEGGPVDKYINICLYVYIMDSSVAVQLSKIFKAVADPTRQRILLLLREKGELSVGEIAKALNATQPATSQHLRVLKEAEALLTRRSGQQIYYRLCSTRLCDAVGEFVKAYTEEVAKSKQDKGGKDAY